MRTMYRALGVTAIVTLLALIVQVVIIVNTARIQGLPEPPPSFPFDTAPISFYATYIWPLIARMFAPIIATFSVVVAGQTRRWGWLAVFIVTGLVGMFSVTLLYFFPIIFAISGASPITNLVITQLATEIIPPAIPAIAALVFAALSLRARRSTQEAAAQQGQA